jgi:hypothetical protein
MHSTQLSAHQSSFKNTSASKVPTVDKLVEQFNNFALDPQMKEEAFFLSKTNKGIIIYLFNSLKK